MTALKDRIRNGCRINGVLPALQPLPESGELLVVVLFHGRLCIGRQPSNQNSV
jgi:hypothetical protein